MKAGAFRISAWFYVVMAVVAVFGGSTTLIAMCLILATVNNATCEILRALGK